MQNTRFLSRFGGLIFFVLALLVVGLLVYLTVKSARDNDQISTNNNTTISEPDTTKSTSNENKNNGTDSDGSTSSTNLEADVFPSQSTNENTANQPDQTVTTNPDNQVVANTQVNLDSDLPNTGPEANVLAFIMVIIISYSVTNYLNSKKALRSEILSGE